MVRTVVAFDSESVRNSISDLLEKKGIVVRYRCRTGHEVIRAIKKMGGGIVICGYKLLDITTERLAVELGDSAYFLLLAKPPYVELWENEDIFKLSMPVHTGELIGSVNMLIQLDQQRSKRMIPRRNEEDEKLIKHAKELLMWKNSMTEDQAHRFIQRKSMETSSKMTETAKLIIGAFEVDGF